VSLPPHTLSVEEGIVITRVPGGIVQDVPYALASLQASIDARGGIRRSLLVDARAAEPLSTDVRHIYKGEALSGAFTAFAMLVESNPVGRLMGNIYLRIARLPIPARIFADEEAARAWLRGYRL